MAQNLLTNRLGRYHLSMNKEYKERFQDNMPQTHDTYYTLQFLILHLTVILRRSI